MKFDTPATTNPIDQLRIVGKPTRRIDGGLKTTGTAPYAYERHDAVKNPAYGVIVGSAIAKGRIASHGPARRPGRPGRAGVVTSRNAGKLGKGEKNTARLLGGPGDRALPPGRRHRGRGNVRAGARRRDARCSIDYEKAAGPLRPGGREGRRPAHQGDAS